MPDNENNNFFGSLFDQVSKSSSSLDNKVIYSFSDEEISNKTKTEFISNPDYQINAALNIKELSNDEINDIASDILREKQQSNKQTIEKDNKNNSSTNAINEILKKIEATGSETVELVRTLLTDIADFGSDTLNDFSNDESMAAGLRTLSNLGSNILNVISQNLKNYQDGISETSFGAKMEESWYGNSSTSFLNYFRNKNSSANKINILKSTPLDSGEKRTSIYGSMVLGTPFLFNDHADPDNRVLINTLVKDGKILSLTPGMPKFNGTSYDVYGKSYENLMNQTKEPSAMLNYLLKNGLDSDFANKDKRYYTFQTDYEAYFTYLETMLNAIWIKMGLAKNGEEFNLFSFFKIKNNKGIDPSGYKDLKSQYNSSIGFFTNIAGAVSESVDSQRTSFGSELSQNANSKSDNYQRLNYIHGMGTGGGLHNAMRTGATVYQNISDFKELMGGMLNSTQRAISNVSSKSGLKKVLALVKVPLAFLWDTASYSATQDLGSVLQSFATSNGMKLVYPELWSDSDYSKNMNFNFSFISPYGDPLSIFKYVYVPFCALACFAFPRQAAENGYVSPFFIRADVPGVITSDLAMISSFTWTKGGGNNLWTKDGLPRAIDVSVSISDLYPYLAMTKRLSFLSANPSYAVFLDNLSGMMSLTNGTEDDTLNSYFSKLINRVNGLSQEGTNMWNKFNSTKSKVIKQISEETRNSISSRLDPYSIPWLHNSSIS